MAENVLEILIRARDEATRTITQATQSVAAAQRSTEQGAVAFTRASGQMERSAVSFSQRVSGASASARFLGFTVINELSPALGTGASRIASLASVATLGGSAITALATVAIGGLVLALGNWIQAARKAKEAQEELNKAVSSANVVALTKVIAESQKEIAALTTQIEGLQGLQKLGAPVASTLEAAQLRLAEALGKQEKAHVGLNLALKVLVETQGQASEISKKKALADLQDETQTLVLTEATSEAAAALARITAEKQRDTDATIALLQAESLEAREAEMLVGIREAQARATQRAREELEELERAATEKAEESAIATVRRASEARIQPIRDAFDAVDRAITGTISGLLQGTQTVEEAMRRMAQNIAISLVEQIVQRGLRKVQEALIDTFLLGQSGGGGGGLLGTILGTIGSIFIGGGGGPGVPGGGSPMGPPQFAQHGAHLFAFQPAIVGEAGPELFIPRVAGDVIPNDKLGGTTIQFFIDARGADVGVETRLKRMIRDHFAAAIEISVRRVEDERRRGGMRGFGR